MKYLLRPINYKASYKVNEFSMNIGNLEYFPDLVPPWGSPFHNVTMSSSSGSKTQFKFPLVAVERLKYDAFVYFLGDIWHFQPNFVL